MDRQVVYPGSIPLDTDILSIQRNTMVALGYLAQATLGSNVIVDGLSCSQQTVPNMTVAVGPGSLVSLQTVDTSAFGSLALSASPLVKVCVNLASTTTATMPAPVSSGQSIAYLIQAAFSETDATAVVLPYYNASNPASPYSGPANSGAAQNTQRVQSVFIGVKAGTSATTGTQVTPTPDSGFVGLYVVTVAFGATSIVNANIALYATAPFIPAKLGPGTLPGFSHAQSFTTSGSWTVPNSVNRARVRVWGAGGGSGGTFNAATAGSQGAAGGYAESILTGLVPGTVETVTIGAGGTAGVSTGGGAGGTGGSTSFAALMSATGGGGGLGSTSGSANVVPAAGQGFSGNVLNMLGGVGSCGFALGGGMMFAAQGGAAPFGGPQAGGGASNVSAANGPGLFPGGGAGGSVNQSAGLAGAGGLVIVEW